MWEESIFQARTTWSAARACCVGHRGTGSTGEETVVLTGAPVPLLTEGHRKQGGLIIEFAFLTLAICIANLCK